MKVISLTKQEQKHFNCFFCTENNPVVMIVRNGHLPVSLCRVCYKTK